MKNFKDLLAFKDGEFEFEGNNQMYVKAYYKNKLLGTAIFLKNNNIKLVNFDYEDFSKYFTLSPKELLNIIVEYVTNKFGVEVDTKLYWWL